MKSKLKNKQKPRYDGACRDLKQNPNTSKPSVIRFKNPQHGDVLISDLVRGEVRVQNIELDDLVLARSDGSPTYHLTVVVDDMDMDITHVIRGDDHLNNTPRQSNIFSALGKSAPIYAHIPLIHGIDGKRLSKRHGAVSVNQYRKEGYLPEGLLNYLARLGWSHGDQEIFTINELIEYFDLDSVQQSAATFDADKFLWVNHQHMKKISGIDLKKYLNEYFTSNNFRFDEQPDLCSLYDSMKDRSKTLLELCNSSQFLYQNIDEYDEKSAKKNFTQEKVEVLTSLRTRLSNIQNWTTENIHAEIKSTAESMDLKMGNVAPPLRLAVTGGANSPSIDVTLKLLGAKKTINRINRAIEYIASTV